MTEAEGIQGKPAMISLRSRVLKFTVTGVDAGGWTPAEAKGRSMRIFAAGIAIALSLFGTATVAQAATPPAAERPCDIYAAGGTPCVAAHSTTRALYASYNGPLYAVKRLSDQKVR